jgi:hypothetical protein
VLPVLNLRKDKKKCLNPMIQIQKPGNIFYLLGWSKVPDDSREVYLRVLRGAVQNALAAAVLVAHLLLWRDEFPLGPGLRNQIKSIQIKNIRLLK